MAKSGSGGAGSTTAASAGGEATTAAQNVLSTGAGAIWHFRGGSFQSCISTDFAIFIATIEGSADPIEGGPVTLTATENQAIYSRPMYVVDPIKSTSKSP